MRFGIQQNQKIHQNGNEIVNSLHQVETLQSLKEEKRIKGESLINNNKYVKRKSEIHEKQTTHQNGNDVINSLHQVENLRSL